MTTSITKRSHLLLRIIAHPILLRTAKSRIVLLLSAHYAAAGAC